MRILIICDHFPSYGTKSIRFLVDALKDLGHTVLIASSDVGIKGEILHKYDSKYQVYRIPSIPITYVPYTYTFSASFHLKKLCEKFRPDIIHTQFMMYWLSLSSASLADEGWPIILTLHGLTLPSEPSSFFARFALDVLYQTMGARLIRKSSAVVCVSKNVKNKLDSLHPNLDKPVEVIHIGLNRNESTLQVSTLREDMRQELGLTGKRVFIYLGRVVRDKGVFELAKAFRIVRKHNKNVALLVVGDGQALTRMQNLLNGVPDVHFVGYRTNVGDYLNAADITVLPSYREGLPTSILEAMFLSLPVISTNVGGIQDLQELGAKGIIVPVKNVGRLASAMQKLANAEETILSSWGKQNKALISEKFMWNVIAEQIIDLYQRVIDNHQETR
jgi:glycosyltransferase involved in cell wall biosynthesis